MTGMSNGKELFLDVNAVLTQHLFACGAFMHIVRNRVQRLVM